MRRRSEKTKALRKFILDNVAEHPTGIGKRSAERFGISRQAVSRHLNDLVKEGLLTVTGQTRRREFRLRKFIAEHFRLAVGRNSAEDVIWSDSIQPLLTGSKENVLDICEYGFTEMVNNVISHSGSETLSVSVKRSAGRTRLQVHDEGIGIFKKIQDDFNLHDPRHALLELSKGKLTSDPSRHTGEGIFFTSRMFDVFSLWSENFFFARRFKGDGWLTQADGVKQSVKGTCVYMEISEDSEREMKEVFDEYASEDAGWGFTRTHVVLGLLRHENGKLLSRSQAKRLLSRTDQFREVVLDFQGIAFIGQAFADEIFRVYRNRHPEVVLHSVHTTDDVEEMIARVLTL